MSDRLDQLAGEVRRWARDRYPVQHGIACFHLGMALTEAGHLEDAEESLGTAVRLFRASQLPIEHAKAMNALGAVLREARRLDEAADGFARAAKVFERQGLATEHGAALVNLGLASREAGDWRGAARCFERARECLPPRSAHAAAAARELGATLLAAGEAEAAATALADALTLAERAGDQVGARAAANALGLARLAAGDVDGAIEGLTTAVSATPRSQRPQEFAMASANLALAYEQAGNAPRARLAARHALAVPGAPEPVVDQARAASQRLGGGPGDVLSVLDSEDVDSWQATLRGELARLNELEWPSRLVEASAWIEGHLTRPERGVDLAGAWLDAVLELPSDAFESLIASLLMALRERQPDEVERFRADLDRAMVRLHPPQLMRVRDAVERIASEVGLS